MNDREIAHISPDSKKDGSFPSSLPELNPQQRAAVSARRQPLLIVAGAGTGKTRTLTSRLLYLLHEGVEPHRICAITFTNKAAQEMAGRIAQSAWLKARHAFNNYKPHITHHAPFIGTFHSFGARILRAECGAFNRTPDFVIFDEHDSLQLIKKICKSVQRDDDAPIGPAHMRKSVSLIKNGVLALADLARSSDQNDKTAARVFRRYEKELERHNAFDFDDLIQKVVYLFKRNPAAANTYQKKFPHVLIDEYQDLNNKQYELVRLIARGAESLSVVGDANQMIYGWRGSNIEIFLNFKNDWGDAQTVSLEENYRSTQNIIGAASAVIRHNSYNKSGWMASALWTKNPLGSPIQVVETRNEEEEARFVVSRIRELRANAASSPEKENANAGQIPEIAILYRTNAQSRALEDELIRNEIPYEIFGGLRFYERKEVKDILAGLRYAVNPRDLVSYDRLKKAFTRARFSAFIDAVSRAETRAPLDLINIFIRATDYLAYLEKNFTNAEERRENVGSLIAFASTFERLSDFLERVALFQETDRPHRGAKDGAVKLMTIHLAKGLEFAHVFIAGCSEGLLPHARSLVDQQELEEERRLVYVAMTRAKKELTMSFCDIPSRFLHELPEETFSFYSFVSDADGGQLRDNEERYITLD